MLKISIQSLNAIASGLKPAQEVLVYWQEPETYTTEDLQQSVGDISTSMSGEGGYEIANTAVVLKNRDYYFSHRFSRELPNNKLVEIYLNTGFERILMTRGVVNSWQLNELELTLNINA